jgi:seryl-tRNA synthetase
LLQQLAPVESLSSPQGTSPLEFLEQYEAGLKRREQEVRAELGQVSAADKSRIALLEKQLTEIQAKLKNPEGALEEYKAKLAEAYKAFDDLKREVLPEQIKQARDALTKGETAIAEELFRQVLSRGHRKMLPKPLFNWANWPMAGSITKPHTGT